MKLFRNTFLEAKLHGKRASLLTRAQIHSLSELRNLEELISFLGETGYAPVIQQLQEGAATVEALERAFNLAVASDLREIAFFADSDARGLLEQYAVRLDSVNLAALLSYKADGKSWDQLYSQIIPMGGRSERRLRALYAFDTLEELVLSIEPLGLREGLRQGLEAYRAKKEVSLLSDRVLAWGYELLWDHINIKLPSNNRERCKAIIGPAIDLFNILLTVRFKAMGLSGAESFLIKAFHNLSYDVLMDAADADDVTKAFEILSVKPYRQLLLESRSAFQTKKSLADVEANSRLFLRETNWRVFSAKNPVTALLTAYIELKLFERHNLVAVTNGIGANLVPEAIRAYTVA